MAITYRDTPDIPAYPLWITAPFTGFVVVLVPVYWRSYGPGNFLWFSDIALFAVLLSLWTGKRLPYSMVAVGVLPLELAWAADFFAGSRLTGMTGYMFSPDEPLHLRFLSGFHLFLPPLVLLMLARQGYDRRAFPMQIPFAWSVIAASRLLTERKKNINWVHGFGSDPRPQRRPALYLAAYMALAPAVFLPMHLLLKRLFHP